MKELLRSNDAVLISFVSSLLEEARVGFAVADLNMSVLEGSIGALPRRVLVEEDQLDPRPPHPDRGRNWPCPRRRRPSLSVRRSAHRQAPVLTIFSAAASLCSSRERATARAAMPSGCKQRCPRRRASPCSMPVQASASPGFAFWRGCRARASPPSKSSLASPRSRRRTLQAMVSPAASPQSRPI